jgi:hypothetical protein
MVFLSVRKLSLAFRASSFIRGGTLASATPFGASSFSQRLMPTPVYWSLLLVSKLGLKYDADSVAIQTYKSLPVNKLICFFRILGVAPVGASVIGWGLVSSYVCRN